MRKALIFDDDAQALSLLQTFLSVNDIDVSAHLNPTCLMYQTNSENCPLNAYSGGIRPLIPLQSGPPVPEQTGPVIPVQTGPLIPVQSGPLFPE